MAFCKNVLTSSRHHRYLTVPWIELHVADVLDAVAGQLQLGDEGIEVVGDVVQVIIKTGDDVIETEADGVTRAS